MPGLHHVSIMCRGPQANAEFYTGVLGLRFVKQTVNFDDPGSYHLYYGNDTGEPGTALTFFPWPDAPPARTGAGEASATRFAIPPGALSFWIDRLREHRVNAVPLERFGERGVAFVDHDEVCLELVETDRNASIVPSTRSIDAAHAIRGFDAVTLRVSAAEHTSSLLTETFGYVPVGREGKVERLQLKTPGPAAVVEVVEDASAPRARLGAGSVHHVAFRARDDAEQATIVDELQKRGFSPTPVQERFYFRSVYFRERGGILFEIATDTPGFTVDEPADSLGKSLKLPPWFESQREAIARGLPPLKTD